MKLILHFLLLTILISVSQANECTINGKTVTYDCQDIKTYYDCRNQKSGVECYWSGDRCTYLKCEDLPANQCFGQNVFGAKCLLDNYQKCKSITKCSQIGTTEQCTQIGFLKCFWDPKYLTCRTLTCGDISNSTQCMQSHINGYDCQWYNAQESGAQCQIAQCSLKSLYRCDGYNAGLNYCISDNNKCRDQNCQDFKSTTSKACIDPNVYPMISQKTFCASLPQANGIDKYCSPVEQCSDINDKFICEDIRLINQQKCKWDEGQNKCRIMECTDFNSLNCPDQLNFQTCFVRNDVCKSCQSFSDPCSCISDPMCQLKYNQNLQAYVCTLVPILPNNTYLSSVEDMKWDMFQYSGSSILIIMGVFIQQLISL